MELALFRVAQECLGNIQRHSGSASARISLNMAADATTLEVQDEGRGIPPEVLRRGVTGSLGVGISGMRERLLQLGGTLEILPGNPGTLVRATLPTSPSGAAEDNPQPASA